jgi:hypothetical protein
VAKVEGGVLAQDRLVQPGDLADGVDAEFSGEPARELPVGAEGFGLAARAVQGEHQLRRDPLP